MVVWTKQKYMVRWPSYIFPLFTVLFLLYFGVYFFTGDYGLLAEIKVEGQIKAAQQELSKLEEKYSALRHEVSLLKDGGLQQDILDEYLRKNNNVSQTNDLIIDLKNYTDLQEKG